MIEVERIDYSYAYKPGQRWSMTLSVRNNYPEPINLGVYLIHRETGENMGSLVLPNVAPNESRPSIWTSIVNWEGEVPLRLICGKIEGDKFFESKSLDFTVREGSFNSGYTYAGLPWWVWSTSTYECVLALFGGGGSGNSNPYAWTNPLYRDDWDRAYSPEKERFVLNLQRSGFNVFSNQKTLLYNSTSTWLEDLLTHLKELGYQKIHLFGFSAGGTIIAYEVQKPYAADIIDSALIASAIVDWPPGYNDPIFKSAETAQNLQTKLYIVAPVEDDLSYDWLVKYYENAKNSGNEVVLIDWTNGHDVFKTPSLDGRHLLEVALECYKSESQ